jgi:hypothetical protein
MYEHLQANAVFNCLYCLANIFSLMNICVFPRTSYCSQIHTSYTSQYFKVYLLLFLGNALRLSTNFSYMFLSVCRFFESTSSKNVYFKKFEKLKFKKFYSILFVTCLAFSSFKIFQFSVDNHFSVIDKTFPFDVYSFTYCKFVDTHPSNYVFLCNLFLTLNLANNILNDVAFFLISILIDILMIRFANDYVKEKRTLNVSTQQVNEAVTLRKKIYKLIFTNGLLYFFSHTPEFLLTISLLVIRKNKSILCVNSSCSDLIEMVQTFNFIVISMQFFVFYCFDRNFAKCFKKLINPLST